MPEITIKDSIYNEVKSYCEVNEITDIESFINKLLVFGLSNEKFGRPVDKAVKSEDNLKPIEPPVIIEIKKDIYGE